MAFKPVVDIDVNDSEFQAFIDKFEKFRDGLKDIPAPFKDMESRIRKLENSVSKLITSMKGKNNPSKPFDEMDKKLKKIPHSVDHANKAFKRFGHTLKDVGKIIKGILSFALKLVGIPLMFGTFGAAAMFGLADSASNRSLKARSLGMRVGTLSAIKTAFGGVLNSPASTAETFSQAYTSPAGRSMLYRALGTQWRTESKGTAFVHLLERAQELAKTTPRGLLAPYASALGYTGLGISVGDLRSMKNMTHHQLMGFIKIFEKARHRLNFSTQTAMQWARLNAQLKEAGVEIETVLIKDLVKLAPTIRSIISTIERWLNNPKTNDAIKKFANNLDEGIKKFAKWFEGPNGTKFNEHMDDFISGISRIAKASIIVADVIIKVADALNWLAGPTTAKGKAKLDLKAAKGMMERAEGTSRYPAAKAYYEEALKRYHQVNGAGPKMSWVQGHNPFGYRPYPGDASYLAYVPSAKKWEPYARFSSWGQAFRKGASTIRGYHEDTLAGILHTWEGRGYNEAHLRLAERVSGLRGNQKLNLNNKKTMAEVLAGVTVNEEPINKAGWTKQDLYDVIYRALVDSSRQKSGGTAGSVNLMAHAARY